MRKYYLKLSGTDVVQRMAYDGPTGLTGYTEVTEAIYEAMNDNTNTYAYSAGVLTPTARTYTNDEIRRQLAPDFFDAIEAAARAVVAVDNGDPIPSDADTVVGGINGTYGDYPP